MFTEGNGCGSGDMGKRDINKSALQIRGGFMEVVIFESTLGTMEFPGRQRGEQNLGTRFAKSKSWTMVKHQ